MNRSIHVMQLIDGMEIGGAEIILRDLTQGLLTRGFHVSIGYCTPGSLISEFEKMGVELTHLPWNWVVDPLLFFRLYRYIKSEAPNIVHTHLFKSDFHGRLAARICGVKAIVSTLHSCNEWAKNPVIGSIYGLSSRLADRLISVSGEVYDFSVRYMHVPPSRTVTISNGVSVEKYSIQQKNGFMIRKEFGIELEAPLLGIVARLAPPKDHKNFLRAAKLIKEAYSSAYFFIVGDGPLRESLKQMTQEFGLDQSVIFTGQRKDIPEILAALDILVISSHFEGLPVSLLEGMAAKLPIVATATGGINDVVIDGETGLLVPPADPIALADACKRLLGDADLRYRMGRAGKTRVNTYYSLNTMIKKTIEVYEALL